MQPVVQSLPSPLPSNIVYDGVRVDNLVYDPIMHQYTARVYGMCRGEVLPLIVSTAVAVRRVEDVVITDTEIDAVLAAQPAITDRVQAAFVRAFTRLNVLANEQPAIPS